MKMSYTSKISDQQQSNGATSNLQDQNTLSTSGYQNWQAIAAREPFHWNDIHSLRFVIQIFFSSIILVFCLLQLATSKDAKNDAIYWGGVTGILALWMPSPSSSGTNQSNQANIGSVNNPEIKLDGTNR